MSNDYDESLRIVAEFTRERHSVHDYNGLPVKAVVHALAESHRFLLNTGGPINSPTTSHTYGDCIRRFVRWLDRRMFTGTLADVNVDMIAEYLRVGTRTRHGISSMSHLICTYADLHPNMLDSAVLQYVRLAKHHRRSAAEDGPPIPPLTEGEARRLEQACKQRIDDLEKRIAYGKELILRGESEAAHGIVSSASIAWLLNEHGPMPIEEVGRFLGIRATTVYKRWAQDNASSARTMYHVSSFIFPTSEDMGAFIILFGLATGLSPECIPEIDRADVKPIGNDRVRITYRKERARGKETETFSRKGRWSPGRLVERANLVTERARVFVEQGHEDRIWLRRRLNGHDGREKYIAAPACYDHMSEHRFVAHAGILDDRGEPLAYDSRRLRKTWYNRQDKRYSGSVHITAGINQSLSIAADHYLSASGETPAIVDAIEGTQHGNVRRARQARANAHVVNVGEAVVQLGAQTKATTIDNAEMETLLQDPNKAGKRLGVTADKAKMLLQTQEGDVFMAICKAFYDSPFGKPGHACPVPPWICLLCPLAVITPTKLPTILAFLDFINDRFDAMISTEWVTRYGAVHRAITKNILPQFSPAVIAAARATAKDAMLYIRPEELI